MLSIAQHLVKVDSNCMVLVLSGSNALPAFSLSDRMDYIKLPCLRRTLGGKYGVKSLKLPFQEVLDLRANLILNTVLGFEPDLVMVDKKPFGVGNELFPVLDLLERRTLSPRMVLLLRDVLDNSESTRALWEKNRYHDAIERYYDEVLVVGQSRVFDMVEEYAFPAATAERLRYCGYIQKHDPENVPSGPAEGDSGEQPRQVLVTPGGGEDGMGLVESYVGGILRRPPPNTCSLIILGPEFHREARQRVLSAIEDQPHIECHDFTDCMHQHMLDADLVVSMAGYNTTFEALSLNRRMLLVPRNRPSEEQLIRAQKLGEMGLVNWIHPDRLSENTLIDAVEQSLQERSLKGARELLRFNGLDRVCDAVGALVDDSFQWQAQAAL